MADHVLRASFSNVQWAGAVIDRLIAPEYSTLTAFNLPDVPPLPQYFNSLFLNNVFREAEDNGLIAVAFSMIRRLTQATREYADGRAQLMAFSAVKPCGPDAIAIYLRALSHFEQAIVQCDLAVSLSHAVVRILDKNASKKHFKLGESSPEERLRFLCNAIKHFDGTVVQGNLPETATPVWITSDGLRGIFEEKKGASPTTKLLKFDELANILIELEVNSKFLAEDAYELARQRLSRARAE